MDLRFTEADEAFRAGLRGWLAATLPQLPPEPDRHDWPARVIYDTDWQRRLFDAGYAGLGWPEEYGGRDATPSEQLVFLEETSKAKAPYVGVNFVGTLHAGPTLIAEGTDAQKERHVPRILRGEEVWCQCFSEPDAGSDLAGLKTRAVRDGDHYVVTGRKIWSSFGLVGEFGELLARTDADVPKHQGISWFILPMDLPGVEVRGIETVLGSSEFCEVFLDEVRVPAQNIVGRENDGWRVTNVTLSFERGISFVSEMVDAMRAAEELAPLVHDPADRRELGHVIAEFDALWALIERNVSRAAHHGDTGLTGLIFKLAYTEARDRLGDLSMRVLDRGAFDVHNPYVEERLRTLSLTIAAGTSQIQRNIIGERVLGLPRERAWPREEC
jgi:alkylation response protein AidB-like acyl-CoA dehydrogenase